MPEPAGREPRIGARAVAYRGGGFDRRSVRVVGPVVFVCLIALWEAGSRSGLISALVLPAPSEAFAAFRELVDSGMLWKHLGASLQRLIVGWTCGTILGVAVGFSIALFSLARAGLVPLVSAIFPIPKIALLPLFIIWFGIGEGSKVATILFGTFFPTVIATYGGVDNVDRTLIRMGQSFDLHWASIVRKIILPGALPAILSGFRISASIAIIPPGGRRNDRRRVRRWRLHPARRQPDGDRPAHRRSRVAVDHGADGAWLIGRAERYFLRWR